MRVTSRVCAVVVALACASAVRAQDGAKPGPEHELLKKMVGDWTLTMKFAGMETKGALQRYDEHVLRLRDGDALPLQGVRRRRA